MLDDVELEQLAFDSAQVFTLGQSMTDFIELMQVNHYNCPPYILRVMFKAVRAQCELKKEAA